MGNRLSIIASDQQKVVIGLGKTGYSVLAFFAERDIDVLVMDTREEPPFAQQVRENFPNVKMVLGGLNEEILCAASQIILSPGLALSTPEIKAAVDLGVSVVGDVQVFADHAKAPVIAITGSNAKSTVTTLVGEMAKQAGLKTAVGGNLGTPALDLINDEVQLYVMELSSFQLETTPVLKASVATVLNVSPDHLDRYDNNYLAYHQAKHKIFLGCESVVVNKDDALSAPMIKSGVPTTSFTLSKPDLNEFGIVEKDGENYLAKFNQPLLACRELKIKGSHNHSNALAALALGEAVNLPMQFMLEALKKFPGLEHRCMWVGQDQGVDYFNDSKGTNVGAAEAAILGLGPDLNGEIVLMAGGDGKGAEFEFLQKSVKQYVKTLVLYGRDKLKLADALTNCADIVLADDFEQAFNLARENSTQGDAILLSPACASFDMFNSFEHRGDTFVELVDALKLGSNS